MLFRFKDLLCISGSVALGISLYNLIHASTDYILNQIEKKSITIK